MTGHQNQEFWRCSGSKENEHIELNLTPEQDRCPECGKKRPYSGHSVPIDSPIHTNNSTIPHPIPTEPVKPKKNRQLLAGLIVLNIISGYTTMQGATQVLPRIAGYTAGATIQFLLFLLLSSKENREHLPKFIRWSVIGSLSLLSVYTSFFTYYELMTDSQRDTDKRNRVISAHQSLVSDVFTPIQSEIEELKSNIASKQKQIEEEEKGRRASGIVGCGPICNRLKAEKETLDIQYQQDNPVLDKLKLLFEYNTQGKEPQEIFNSDLKALGKVNANCLPSNPAFACLPEQYRGVLNPQAPEHKTFKGKYFDEDLDIGLLAPFLKIKRGEAPAIGAATIALIIDGCIILLGLGIEASRQRKKIPLNIMGKGSDFLDKLSNSIDHNSLTIDAKTLDNTENSSEYRNLLQTLFTKKNWLFKDEEEQKWQIVPENSLKELISWINEERTEMVKQENSLIKIPQNGHPSPKTIYLRLPD